MSQTSYPQSMPIGRAGMIADSGNRDVVSRVNPVDVIPFGVGVCKGTADRDVKLPVAASDVSGQGAFQGVALVDDAMESVVNGLVAGFVVGSPIPVLKKGRVWVVVEEAVAMTDPVYVRIATGIADNTKIQLGAFRKSADGTAQVATLTPTAVNSTAYNVTIDGRSYSYVSDGSATAAEIVTGLKTLINAETALTGVTGTGTVTLILTGTAGTAFVVQADSNQAIVATTANAQSAERLTRARWVTSALAGGLAQLEVNIP